MNTGERHLTTSHVGFITERMVKIAASPAPSGSAKTIFHFPCLQHRYQLKTTVCVMCHIINQLP